VGQSVESSAMMLHRQLVGAAAPLGTIYSFQMVGAGTGMVLGGWRQRGDKARAGYGITSVKRRFAQLRTY
jgi:hypothetical protein